MPHLCLCFRNQLNDMPICPKTLRILMSGLANTTDLPATSPLPDHPGNNTLYNALPGNSSLNVSLVGAGEEGTSRGTLLDNLQIIKVVVLVVVLALLLLSTASMLLKTLSRYGSSGRRDDRLQE